MWNGWFLPLRHGDSFMFRGDFLHSMAFDHKNHNAKKVAHRHTSALFLSKVRSFLVSLRPILVDTLYIPIPDLLFFINYTSNLPTVVTPTFIALHKQTAVTSLSVATKESLQQQSSAGLHWMRQQEGGGKRSRRSS